MNLEILAAVAALLEQGIVVEPYGVRGAVRVRLADDDDSSETGTETGETGLTW